MPTNTFLQAAPPWTPELDEEENEGEEEKIEKKKISKFYFSKLQLLYIYIWTSGGLRFSFKSRKLVIEI